MKLVIDIPEEQIEKSLKESGFVLEDEGIKGSVNIVMLCTNGRLESVDIERREDFYSCNFTPLPKGHGDLKDADKLKHAFINYSMAVQGCFTSADIAAIVYNSPTIIEADAGGE